MAVTWEGSETTQALTLAGPGALIDMSVFETVHVQIDRTDAGFTDQMIISIETTVDGVLFDVLPTMEIQLAFGDDPFSFTIAGYFGFRIRLAATGATDAITATARFIRRIT